VASCLQVTDYRTQFSKWWVSEWKAVAFPEKGLVFDYYVDETQVRWLGVCKRSLGILCQPAQT
jgi:hypothetical protein